jgi:dGTPase
VELWRRHFGAVCEEYPALPPENQCRLAVKRILNFLVTELIHYTQSRISAMTIKSAADVREKGKGVVDFSPEAKRLSSELKKFLYARLYRHYRVERMAAKAERVITELFQAYQRNPRILPHDFVRHYTAGEPVERIVCDYIAGMTDRFALQEYGKLFDPLEKV